MTSEGKGRSRPIAFRLDSGDAVILGPEHPLTIVGRARPVARASSSATGWKPSSRGRSITSSPKSRWPKAHDPPGVWSDGAFFPLEPRA